VTLNFWWPWTSKLPKWSNKYFVYVMYLLLWFRAFWFAQ